MMRPGGQAYLVGIFCCTYAWCWGGHLLAKLRIRFVHSLPTQIFSKLFYQWLVINYHASNTFQENESKRREEVSTAKLCRLEAQVLRLGQRCAEKDDLLQRVRGQVRKTIHYLVNYFMWLPISGNAWFHVIFKKAGTIYDEKSWDGMNQEKHPLEFYLIYEV